MKALRHGLVASGLMLTLIAPAFAGAALDRVMSTKTLVMSSDPQYPPQSFLNDKGEMDGFDVDVGKEIAKRLGARIKIVTPSWDVITAGGWAGRWDISVGSMAVTTGREKVLDFPAIYYYTEAAFAVDTTSNINNISELNDKVIGVCSGCTYESYLEKNLKIDTKGLPPVEYQVTPKKIKTYDTDTMAFDDLRLGEGVRLDAVLSDLTTIRQAIKSGYLMKVIGKPIFYEPNAVAIDKGDPEFDAKLHDIIEAMHKDGTLTTLSKKWYGADLTEVK
jgi:polar amino acid transport system substrate-binding protein